MRVSDVISNVTKQNMNVMASTSTCPCKCKIFISSVESGVYNKKKIQMSVVNMTFISSREVKKMYISFVPSAYSRQTFEYPLYIFYLRNCWKKNICKWNITEHLIKWYNNESTTLERSVVNNWSGWGESEGEG